MNDLLTEKPVSKVYLECPYLSDFFLSLALDPPPTGTEQTLQQWFDDIEYCTLDEVGVERAELPEQFCLFIKNMKERRDKISSDVQSITIIGGKDKFNNEENVEITLTKGEVISIVGPTGSGKSRLLGDIEWLAQGDTPTRRKILIDGQTPPVGWRFSDQKKLVAQLSQNMNFVMDISVNDYIKVHCESRLIENTEEKTKQIIEAANILAGEPIDGDMPVTALSGGQSRALMIADTAYLSSSPIVLIDEIENAGINRKTAIELLTRVEKIVLIATHDPVLALNADRRIVVRNGGIWKTIETTDGEKQKLIELEQMNDKLMHYRELLRNGDTIVNVKKR